MKYNKSEAKSWAKENVVGQWTTMMTPFTSEDELDETALSKNIEHVLKLGTKGLGFSWNMGEFWSLTDEERFRLMEIVPGMVKKRALTAFQITDTSLKNVIKMGQHAEELDYDLLIIAAPYIMTKTEQQVIDWVAKIADNVNIGLAFYNSPQFGITLGSKALSKMANIKNLTVIKEASFNMQTSIDTHLEAGDKAVISTPDEEIFFFEPYYNFHQQVMFANTSDWRFDTSMKHDYVNMIDLAVAGEIEKAKELYKRVWPVKKVSRMWWSRTAAKTGGALPVQMIKYWGELMGLTHGDARAPVVPFSKEDKEELNRDLLNLGLINKESLEELF